MHRRKFITLIGTAAASWPIVTHAQQPNRMRHVGVFVGLASSADDPIARETVRPFSEAMQAAGWLDGKNIRLHYRFGGGEPTKINESAAELVTLAPDVIYAQGLPATRALHQRTHTIPIVFTQIADPFGFGPGLDIGHLVRRSAPQQWRGFRPQARGQAAISCRAAAPTGNSGSAPTTVAAIGRFA